MTTHEDIKIKIKKVMNELSELEEEHTNISSDIYLLEYDIIEPWPRGRVWTEQQILDMETQIEEYKTTLREIENKIANIKSKEKDLKNALDLIINTGNKRSTNDKITQVFENTEMSAKIASFLSAIDENTKGGKSRKRKVKRKNMKKYTKRHKKPIKR